MKLAVLLTLVLLGGCATPAEPPTPATEPPMISDRLIVAFGDSYTEGFGTTLDKAYPALLTQALDRTVLNKGISGETAGESARRLERDVIRNNPELVIVEFGVNEAYRNYPVERALGDLESLVKRIDADTDARIVIVGVHFWSYQTNFDDGLRTIAERYGTGLVLDVLKGIVSSRRDVDDGDPALRHDPFHPNAKGYALMAERILPEVEARLELREATR